MVAANPERQCWPLVEFAGQTFSASGPLFGAIMKDHSLPRAILIALVLSPLLFFCESKENERTLTIYGTVHVYASQTPPTDYPGSNFVAVIGAQDHVEVIDVVQNRDHIAVKIRLRDGHEGWVFSGESIELYEADCHGPDFRAC
jgi:hypothetical protein